MNSYWIHTRPEAEPLVEPLRVALVVGDDERLGRAARARGAPRRAAPPSPAPAQRPACTYACSTSAVVAVGAEAARSRPARRPRRARPARARRAGARRPPRRRPGAGTRARRSRSPPSAPSRARSARVTSIGHLLEVRARRGGVAQRPARPAASSSSRAASKPGRSRAPAASSSISMRRWRRPSCSAVGRGGELLGARARVGALEAQAVEVPEPGWAVQRTAVPCSHGSTTSQTSACERWRQAIARGRAASVRRRRPRLRRRGGSRSGPPRS